MSIKTSIPRIGKVTYKGAPNVAALPTRRTDDTRTGMLKCVRGFVDDPEAQYAGWFFVTWAPNGAYKVGYDIDPAKSPIGFTAAPSFIADAVRRELIEGGAWK